MPAFALNGNLVYFAAFKSHIGFFPTSSGVAAFEAELSGYPHAKGSIQFPLDEPLPLALIEKIVRFRVAENRAKGAARKGTVRKGAAPKAKTVRKGAARKSAASKAKTARKGATRKGAAPKGRSA